MRRRCGGTSIRRARSNSTSSSNVMRPRSGLIRPAIMLTIVVLPPPEGPNSAVAPPTVSNLATIGKLPNRFSTSTRSMSFSVEARAGAARQPFGRDQRDQRQGDRDDDQPQCRAVPGGYLRVGVDRRGNRLRLAGNVGDERDGGAELAERLGEA